MSLKTYKQKRNFKVTKEPEGTEHPVKKQKVADTSSTRFVIHKHAATRLHYDLRLEVDGVYKSWAVPKGPSLNPKDKRLAVEVEDHPIEYGSFEGTIPQGEYGGGSVIIWDKGMFLADSALQQLSDGKLLFALQGEKIAGAFALVRIASKDDKKNNWLLIKEQDEYVRKTGDVTKQYPKSVVSGLTVEEIGAVQKKESAKRSKRKETPLRKSSVRSK